MAEESEDEFDSLEKRIQTIEGWVQQFSYQFEQLGDLQHVKETAAQLSDSMNKPQFDQKIVQWITKIVEKYIGGQVEQQAKDLEAFGDKFNEGIKKMNETIGDIRKLVESLNSRGYIVQEQLSGLKEANAINQEKIINLDYEVSERFGRVGKEILKLTPLEQFELLQQSMKDVAGHKEVVEINESLNLIKLQIPTLTTNQRLKIKLKKLYEKVAINLEDYAKLLQIQELEKQLKDVDQKHTQNEQALQLQTQNDSYQTITKIKDVEYRLLSSPWKSDLKFVSDQLSQKANAVEFQKLKDQTIPPVQQFAVKIQKFQDELTENRKVLERFDEILLSKASKVDFLEVQTKLGQLVEAEPFEKEAEKMFQRMDVIERVFREQNEQLKILCKDMDDYVVSIGTRRKEQRDINIQKRLIEDLSAQIKEKADQTSLNNLTSIVAHKETMIQLQESIEIIFKQLQQSISIQQEFIRSFTEQGDGTQRQERVRSKIFGYLKGLQNWTNQNTPVPIQNSKDQHRTIIRNLSNSQNASYAGKKSTRDAMTPYGHDEVKSSYKRMRQSQRNRPRSTIGRNNQRLSFDIPNLRNDEL